MWLAPPTRFTHNGRSTHRAAVRVSGRGETGYRANTSGKMNTSRSNGRGFWRAAMSTAVGAAAVVMMQQPVAAQDAAPTDLDRFERTLQQIQRDTRLRVLEGVPVNQRALIDYGGFVTASWLSVDDSELNNRALWIYDAVGYGRVNFDGAHELYIRGRMSYRDYNPGDQFADEEDHLEGTIEEAYYRFDLERHRAAAYGAAPGDYNFVFQGGRQYVEWAGGLVLSNYLDAVRADLRAGPVTVSLLGGVTVFGTSDFDTSRPEFDDTTYRGHYGAMASVQVGRHRPYAYFLAQRDYNPNNEAVTLGIIETEYDYNSNYFGLGATGALTDRLVYTVEGVYENGSSLSNSFSRTTFQPIDQTDDDIEAWAGLVQLDYLFGDPRRTRVGAGLIIASGDPDRGNTSDTFNGNDANTSDQAFNSLGYVFNGLAFAPPASNIAITRASVSTFPFPDTALTENLQIGLDVLVFNKVRKNGTIDEVTDENRYLGIEPDVFINWQVLEDVTITLRYGIFFPGGAVETDDEVRQFIYTAVTYAF